jgi:hypothetical protein
MKTIMIALVATSLFATTAASVHADRLKVERSGEAKVGDSKRTRNAAAVEGKSFDGRSSLGGSMSLGVHKSHRAPSSSGDDETFDGRKFFDDSVINGG